MVKNFQSRLKVMIDPLREQSLRIIGSGGDVGNPPSKTQIPYLFTTEDPGIISHIETGVP
jgi:hypothetical protein